VAVAAQEAVAAMRLTHEQIVEAVSTVVIMKVVQVQPVTF
jgi:hypothetical protein